MKKLLALMLLACAVTAQAADKLIVGASPTPHAEVRRRQGVQHGTRRRSLGRVASALAVVARAIAFINLLAARPDNRNSAAMLKLVQALRSPEAKQFILTRFKGSLLPVF